MDGIILHEQTSETVRELTALARMVTYARLAARDLKIEVPAYCLDVALAAILEEVEERGIAIGDLTKKDSFDVPLAFH